MTTQHRLNALRTILAAACLTAGPALAEPVNPAPPKEAQMTRIRVIVDQTRLAATLDDSTAGRDFAVLLPLTLTLADYHETEKIADLPRKLDTRGAPASYTPRPGDITYFAPWGNLAIFYKPFPNSRGLIRLGAFDGPIDALLDRHGTPVRIELAD